MSAPLSRIIGDTLVWDNHACLPMRPNDLSFLPQLARLKKAGIDIVSLNAAFGDHGPDAGEAMLQLFHDWISKHPHELMLIERAADADEARRSGLLGICFDLESMTALGGDIDRIARFYDLGVRWMLATYNQANEAGGGCLEEDNGLTQFGRAAIAEMNRVGMVVCASHCGYRTAREMIDASASPVIFSHSNASAVWPHPRNIPDHLIRACATRGGVIGINGFGPFLGSNDADPKTYVRHVEHILDLVGDDHVGISLDYTFDTEELNQFIAAMPHMFPPAAYPAGAAMIEPEGLSEIAAVLSARGHAATTLAKIFGGNHRRIAETVWK